MKRAYKRLPAIIILLLFCISCNQGNRSGIYFLRSCNRTAQLSEAADTVDLTAGAKLIYAKRLRDTLNTEYYQAVVMVPNESVEAKAIATYHLPTLMRKADRKNFFARTLVVTDTTSHNVACSALYLFKFEPSKGNYTAKEVKP